MSLEGVELWEFIFHGSCLKKKHFFRPEAGLEISKPQVNKRKLLCAILVTQRSRCLEELLMMSRTMKHRWADCSLNNKQYLIEKLKS